MGAAGPYIGNASPAYPELGSVLANLSITLPGGPEISAVDPLTGWLYLSAPGSHDVAILNGSSEVAVMNVSTSIGGLVADPSNGIVYVLNNESNNVSLIQGLSRIGSIPVGLDPDGAVWDPSSGLVYVANCQSNNVSVLNATGVVATDRADLCPGPPTYDPSNGWVYVPNQQANDVTVLNGSSVVTTIVNLPFSPGRLAFDPSGSGIYAIGYPGESGGGVSLLRGESLLGSSVPGSSTGSIAVDTQTGWAYLSDPAGGAVYILNGTSVEGQISSLYQPDAVAFDPASGHVYVAGVGTSHIPSKTYALQGLKLLGSIAVPYGPVGFAVNPAFPWLDLLEQAGGVVSLLSTTLAVTPTEVSPSGTPVDSTEPGNSVTFNATLDGIGTSIGNVSSAVIPATGLNCPTISEQDADLLYAQLDLNCTASAAGNYTVWFNVSDSSGGSVWSRSQFRVYPVPEAQAPTMVPSASTGIGGALVNHLVTFAEEVLGGTGTITTYLWYGLPTADCTGVTSSSPQCV
ncbi:MAG: YncE family protein, partial [Thermoplasmata archaeon]